MKDNFGGCKDKRSVSLRLIVHLVAYADYVVRRD
jgi:hypothetical protein